MIFDLLTDSSSPKVSNLERSSNQEKRQLISDLQIYILHSYLDQQHFGNEEVTQDNYLGKLSQSLSFQHYIFRYNKVKKNSP